ncbi:hypothetical protein UG54_00750 [Gordonia sihwensis]|nr:hypothetical protein UG54_00750 [Gordonia sihwensis]
MAALQNRPGLYMWVDNLAQETDVTDNAVLYVGIGIGRDGVAKRVHYEHGFRQDGIHAHGLMLKRRNAHALLGEIADTGLNDDWMDWLVANDYLNAVAPDHIRRWRDTTDPVRSAERFAVRLSIHLGDTVAPVNSQYAGAWADDSGADWAAVAAAQWIALDDLGQTPDVTRCR